MISSDSELTSYREFVRNALKSSEPAKCSNLGVMHARVVVEELIGAARESIMILCHNLSSDVYDAPGVVSALEKAYINNSALKMKVITRHNYAKKGKFAEELEAHGVTVQSLSEINTSVITPKTTDIIIVDSKHIRHEINEKGRSAWVYTNDEKRVELLLAKDSEYSYCSLFCS